MVAIRLSVFDFLSRIVIYAVLLTWISYGKTFSGVHAYQNNKKCISGIPSSVAFCWQSRPRCRPNLEKLCLGSYRESSADSAHSQPGSKTQLESEAQIEKEYNQYNTLPRLYVGPRGVSKLMSPNLAESTRVVLSPDQSHYLTKVMRFFSKSKQGRYTKNTQSNPSSSAKFDQNEVNLSECIRIFDGSNGEWLARITTADSGDGHAIDSRLTKKQRRQKSNHNSKSLVAECLVQLRLQNGCRPRQQYFVPVELPPWVIFAPIKKQRAKLLVEKCTELGCGLFLPVVTDHTDPASITACIVNICDDHENHGLDSLGMTSSTASLFQHRHSSSIGNSAKKNTDFGEKLSLVALEASEQCERLTVPYFIARPKEHQEGHHQYNNPWNINELLKNWIEFNDDEKLKANNGEDYTENTIKGRALLICRERERSCHGNVMSVYRALQEVHNGDNGGNAISSVAFLIGPEGGWSLQEEELFDTYSLQHPSTIKSISLGSSVLRAETAGMLAVGAWTLWCDENLHYNRIK